MPEDGNKGRTLADLLQRGELRHPAIVVPTNPLDAPQQLPNGRFNAFDADFESRGSSRLYGAVEMPRPTQPRRPRQLP